MTNIIREVIDIDKKVRQEYEDLLVVKVKLNEYFSLQRLQLITSLSEQIKADIEQRRKTMKERLEQEQRRVDQTFQQKTEELNRYFTQHVDQWVHDILAYCLEK